ncbi:hypothetical protein PUN28_005197 [Cardiocondyla obscurior]|uniref:Uncharacterized protein n=1 Tax=Cardiocondyla obscurior TaxID=286306 RepID=A0AAW2GGI8_9HYME
MQINIPFATIVSGYVSQRFPYDSFEYRDISVADLSRVLSRLSRVSFQYPSSESSTSLRTSGDTYTMNTWRNFQAREKCPTQSTRDIYNAVVYVTIPELDCPSDENQMKNLHACRASFAAPGSVVILF